MNLLCNLKKYDAVAFDFDGTLVNCKTRQVEVLLSILRRKDINLRNFDTDKWWNYKTNGLNTFDALIQLQIPEKAAKYISNCWVKNIENPEWLDLDDLCNNVIPLLQRLKKSDIKIYIITARTSEYLFRNQIRKLNLEQYIEKYFVVNPINGIERKSEILNQLMPSVFVGDTENDFYAAQMSGTKFIAVGRGQRSKYFLSRQGIELLVDNISELSFSNRL